MLQEVHGDLRARVSRPDDEHALPAVALPVSVARGVHELATEFPRPVGDDGHVVVPGRDDDPFGSLLAGRRRRRPAAVRRARSRSPRRSSGSPVDGGPRRRPGSRRPRRGRATCRGSEACAGRAGPRASGRCAGAGGRTVRPRASPPPGVRARRPARPPAAASLQCEAGRPGADHEHHETVIPPIGGRCQPGTPTSGRRA